MSLSKVNEGKSYTTLIFNVCPMENNDSVMSVINIFIVYTTPFDLGLYCCAVKVSVYVNYFLGVGDFCLQRLKTSKSYLKYFIINVHVLDY